MHLSFVVLLFLTTTFVAKAGDSLFVYGTVTGVTLEKPKDLLKGAQVFDTLTHVGVLTNNNGEYRFWVADSLIGKSFYLMFTYVGNVSQVKRVRVRRKSKRLNIVLEAALSHIHY